MSWLGWIVIAIASQLGGWLTFDGSRAFILGDYVTPSSGPYAGQLGPWSKVVSAVGIEPRSTLMKSIHAALGLLWLAMAVCFAMRLPWAWWGLLGCSVATLWYLPFGAVLGVIQIALLLLPQLRAQGGG